MVHVSRTILSLFLYLKLSSLGYCIQTQTCFQYSHFLASVSMVPQLLVSVSRSILLVPVSNTLSDACVHSHKSFVSVSNTLISWLLYPEPYLFPVHSFLGSCIQVPHLLVPVSNIHTHKSFVSVSNTLISWLMYRGPYLYPKLSFHCPVSRLIISWSCIQAYSIISWFRYPISSSLCSYIQYIRISPCSCILYALTIRLPPPPPPMVLVLPGF